MKLGAGIYTYSVFRTGRHELLLRCLRSIVDDRDLSAWSIVTTVNKNGAPDDGTQQMVRDLGGIVGDQSHEIWYAMTLACSLALHRGADIVFLSADDYTLDPGWGRRLLNFWAAAPQDVKLASLTVEPVWQWNTVTDAADIGGERVLFRNSLPGSSWSFRASDANLILPLPQKQPGEDRDVCDRLLAARYRLAALDLSRHEGERISAWNNESWKYARPLDRQRWGLPERRLLVPT